LYIKVVQNYHSWASASRKLTLASAFRHQYFQSGTGPKKCQTALAWSGTAPVLASLVFSFQYWTDRMPGSLAFQHSSIYTHEHAHKHVLAHAHTPMMCSMNMDRNMDMKYGQGHAPWTWTCTMDIEMDKHHGCRNVGMPIKSLVRHC
jgi:hypothetical protein